MTEDGVKPCKHCNKQHLSSRCPTQAGFWRRTGEKLIQWRTRAATAGGRGKASRVRLDNAFKEMRS